MRPGPYIRHRDAKVEDPSVYDFGFLRSKITYFEAPSTPAQARLDITEHILKGKWGRCFALLEMRSPIL